MEIQQLLDSLIPMLGQVGVDALAESLKDLAAKSDKEWYGVALALLSDAVEAHGLAGVSMALAAIDTLFDDENPAIDWASPRTASDFIAKLQNGEASSQNGARDFLIGVGDAFGKVFVGIIKGVFNPTGENHVI